ncbi:hypothetical protein I3V78_00815 [Archangium primigenium]|nr:hypothetical protein [Archangium primigenium]
MADQRYVHSLTRPDVRIRLNFADPQQHRFAMARLKLAGKTPENSPQLFQSVEERRQLHLAKGYKTGLLPQQDQGLSQASDLQEMHFISAASAGSDPSRPNEGAGSASSTYPRGAYYTYVDVSYTDAGGFPLGDLSQTEDFNNGKNTVANAVSYLDRTRGRLYRVSSYKMEDSVTGFTDSFVYSEIGSAAPSVGPPKWYDLIVDHPVDLKNLDNKNTIFVCLDRGGDDCDYRVPPTEAHMVVMPFKGSVRVQKEHLFDVRKIQAIRDDLNANRHRDDAGSIRLIFTPTGGGCEFIEPNTLHAGMKQFWNSVRVDEGQSRFSWDLSGINPVYFGKGCRLTGEDIKMVAIIKLPFVGATNSSTEYSSSITLSNDALIRRDYSFKKMAILNSCLAEGTMIELASGEAAAIESVQSGALISNSARSSLTVMDKSSGIERSPMVRIKDEAARVLSMTEMHPIQVVARGMVQAKDLRKGDVVMTKTGPSKLVLVERHAYTGKVFNLRLGTADEKKALSDEQTVMYANGFLVGDSQIQTKYEFMAQSPRTQGDVLALLPAKWHRDYLLSVGKR